MMKIAFCSDHRGYKLKKELIEKVKNELGYECLDFGCDNENRCDFPVYAFKAAESVAKKKVHMELLFVDLVMGFVWQRIKLKELGVRLQLPHQMQLELNLILTLMY